MAITLAPTTGLLPCFTSATTASFTLVVVSISWVPVEIQHLVITGSVLGSLDLDSTFTETVERSSLGVMEYTQRPSWARSAILCLYMRRLKEVQVNSSWSISGVWASSGLSRVISRGEEQLSVALAV